MKTWITVLCAAVVLAGCTKEKDAGVDKKKLRVRYGLTYFKGKPFTGVAVEKFDNGQKAEELTWKDGKREGLSTGWYENGQKAEEVTYKDGNLVTVTARKPNGEKCPDTNVVDGTGIWCNYYENGQKQVESTYKDGYEHGLRTWWYDNGQKEEEQTIKDGKMISAKYWDEDGNRR